MSIENFEPDRQGEVLAVAPVRIEPDDIVVALRVGGRLTGPVLLVCGRESVCRPVYREIIRLPSLPWLSGTLLLSYVGPVEAREQGDFESEPALNPFFDESLFLDFYGEDAAARDFYGQSAYWTILRKMKEIGMISGRGVRRW